MSHQPLSTGITYQLIPKASADGIPIHSMGYGRTSAANGKVFEWVFNYPANYWNAASVAASARDASSRSVMSRSRPWRS